MQISLCFHITGIGLFFIYGILTELAGEWGLL